MAKKQTQKAPATQPDPLLDEKLNALKVERRAENTTIDNIIKYIGEHPATATAPTLWERILERFRFSTNRAGGANPSPTVTAAAATAIYEYYNLHRADSSKFEEVATQVGMPQELLEKVSRAGCSTSIIPALQQLQRTSTAIKTKLEESRKERQLVEELQQHLKENTAAAAKGWDIFNPEKRKQAATLWEELLYLATLLGWEDKQTVERLALKAIDGAYNIEKGTDTTHHPSIRVLADFTGTPYPRLLQYYIETYGSINAGRNYTLKASKGYKLKAADGEPQDETPPQAQPTPSDRDREQALKVAFDGGSLKQKVRLLFSELDREHHEKPTLLTPEELEHFSNQMRQSRGVGNSEHYYYNIRAAVNQLHKDVYTVLRIWHIFKNFITVWATMEATEDAVNMALLAAPSEQRPQIATVIANRTILKGCSQSIDNNGLLRFSPSDVLGDNDTERLIKEGKQILPAQWGQFKAIIKATQDCIDAYGLGMPETKQEIKNIEEKLTTQLIGLKRKYTITDTARIEKTIFGNILTGIYNVMPDYERVAIDTDMYEKTTKLIKQK